MPRTQSTGYRPDIDGLRALAILPVIFFHAELGCPGGFVGVDVFFVISGFVISALILREIGAGSFSLAGFWERRIRRILPALMVVVIATMLAGWFLFLPSDLAFVGRSVVAQGVMLSNIFFMRNAGYFAENEDAEPLLHTWSLAVEEQFYLLFPLFLIFLAKYKQFPLFKLLLGLAVASFALSVAGTYKYPTETFYLLPTRGWELLMGALLATKGESFMVSKPVGEVAGWLGVGLIGWAICFYTKDTRFPGLAALAPCLGAALIIFSSQSGPSMVGKILGCKPVVFVGLISYSLYLWHWPLLVFTKYCLPREFHGVLLRVVLLVDSVGLAILSWKFVETPFRKRLIFQRRPHIFGFAGTALVLLLVVGVAANHFKGFPSRCPAGIQACLDSRNHNAFHNNVTLQQAKAGQFAEFGLKDTNQPVSVLIWGDSHAMAMTPVLDELCRQFSRRGVQATHSATAPLLDYVSPGTYSLRENSPAFANSVLAFISQNHVKDVVISAYWANFPVNDSFKTHLVSTVRTLMGTGAKVYVMKDVPVPGFDVPRMAAFTMMQHGDLNQLGISREEYELSNRELTQTFDQIAQMGATVLDPAKYFLNQNGIYGVVRNEQVLYRDSDHLTVEGSKLLAPLFTPIFRTE